MPRILVTNDDGIFSEGIKLLAEALGSLGGQAGRLARSILARGDSGVG